MKLIIINGPNLNLLGIREHAVYGSQDFNVYLEQLRKDFPQCGIDYFQSNHEGALIDKLHETGFGFDGIILNAGAYTHTSVALGDAIAAITTPVLEVHISNTQAREGFRHHSFLAARCRGIITGFGLHSYRLAVQSFLLPAQV